MPRNNREYMKRFADEALNDIQRALDNLNLIKKMYANPPVPVHSENDPTVTEPPQVEPNRYEPYIAAIDSIGIPLFQLHEALKLFRNEVI